MEWDTSCPDWKDRIRNGEPLIRFPPLFPAEAASALAVFDELRIVDAIGSPRMGDVRKGWVKDFATQVFGSLDPETGKRLITEFFLLISKKNAKSTTAAAIMLTVLIRNWRKSAEFLILAPTVEIANNSFYPARDMVRADDELSALFLVQDHIRTITHRETNATLKVVAADSETVGGKKATGVLIDELWLFGKRQNAENMLLEACGGLASRPEGFVIYLSTQSDDAPSGVFRKKLLYARKVRDGEITDRQFLPILYEFPPDMLQSGEYLEPDNFWITNPNMDASVSREFLVRECMKAREIGHESMIGFMAKHLNIEIGAALKSDRWAGADYWERQSRADVTLDEILRRSEVITIGIDGGGLDDLLGIAVIGRDGETGQWMHWGHAWAHRSVFERRKSEAARLEDFVTDGDLTIVESIGDDVEGVVAICQSVEDAGLLDKIGIDPYAIGGILDALEDAGIAKEKIIGVPQGWKLVSAIKTCERKLAEGTFIHGGSRMMAWTVGNAKVEPKGNAIAITKQTSGTAKIDPLMAMFNAASLMALNPEPQQQAGILLL